METALTVMVPWWNTVQGRTGYKITFEVQGRLVLKRVNVITFGHP